MEHKLFCVSNCSPLLTPTQVGFPSPEHLPGIPSIWIFPQFPLWRQGEIPLKPHNCDSGNPDWCRGHPCTAELQECRTGSREQVHKPRLKSQSKSWLDPSYLLQSREISAIWPCHEDPSSLGIFQIPKFGKFQIWNIQKPLWQHSVHLICSSALAYHLLPQEM